MRKVINRKMYDTDTAKEVAESTEYDNGNPYLWQTLYQKITGEFFILKEWHSDHIHYAIKPISEEAAKDFAEKILMAMTTRKYLEKSMNNRVYNIFERVRVVALTLFQILNRQVY